MTDIFEHPSWGPTSMQIWVGGGSKFFISHFVWFLQRIALKQFCDQNTSNLRESPRSQKPRERRIIIDSGSDVYSLKWALYRLRKTLNFAGKKLPWLAFGILTNFWKVLRSCAFFMHGCVFAWHKTCFSLVTWQPANPCEYVVKAAFL